MDFTTSITFVSTESGLDLVEEMINDNYLDEYVESYDYQSTEESNMLTLRVVSGNDYSMDIYDIQNKFINVFIEQDMDCSVDVIYSITDSKTFIDVISTSDMYDTRVDNDVDMIEELCSQYGLPFFGIDEEDEEDECDEYGYNYDEFN